jgi:hypothetical protein
MSKSVAAFFVILFLCLALAPTATQAQTTWVSGLSASTTSTTATLTWTTAVPSTTEVRYGLTTTYGTHTTLDPTFVVAHSSTLTGLTPGTLYHLRLLDRDCEPLQLTSIDYTVTTQAAPVSVLVTPAAGTLGSGASQQLTAQVNNATNTAVTWTTTGGSVTNSGYFTAPVVVANQQVTVKATSVADPTKSATAVFTVTAPIQHSVSLNWQPSSSNDIAFYSAYRSLTQGGPYSLLAGSLPGLAYVDSAVQSGTKYYYVVRATDTEGVESADSAEVSAVVPSP